MAPGKGEAKSCVVLVTGASGFLGQHIVGLLQTKADHVTEIRVLDVTQYRNKLEYRHTKPVRSFVGSITDNSLLVEACRGVSSVIHVVGITDVSMFPNEDRLYDIHVNGTLSLLLVALETAGVQRFVYCSSSSVAMRNGSNGVCDDNTTSTSNLLFGPYSATKLAGENMVLMANGPHFRTLSLRPPVMYGELDYLFTAPAIKIAKILKGFFFEINIGDAVQQSAYVGNVAWAFVCAEKTLHDECEQNHQECVNCDTELDSRTHNEEIAAELRQRDSWKGTGSELLSDIWPGLLKAPDENSASGGFYFVTDDTPDMNVFKMHELLLKDNGYRLSKFKIPYTVLMMLLYIVFACLSFLRLFGITMNVSTGLSTVRYLIGHYVFSGKLTRQKLNYLPLFDRDETINRSRHFYQIK